MGAINGDPWQKWTKALNMKSPDDVQRVIDVVRRADPTSATVMWNNGQPHAVGYWSVIWQMTATRPNPASSMIQPRSD